MGKWYNENASNNSVIISSRVRLARNLKKFPFSVKLGNEQGKELRNEVFESLNGMKNMSFINISEKSDLEKLALFERHAVSQDFLQNKHERGLILSSDEKISIMINEEDHIRIQSILSGENIEKAFETADKIDDLIEGGLEYAFDKDFGYLTTCPTNVGTGMRASFMVHLPMLNNSNQLSMLLNSVAKFGMTVRGIFGEGTQSYGHIFQISNQVTIGRNEQEILTSLKNITNQLIDFENNLREKNFKDRTLWEDKIFRALGALKYSRKMSGMEAMGLLSYVRLGIIMGIIDDEKIGPVYNIMMNCRSANIQLAEGEELDSDARDIIRASYLRQVL
ncbi:MAG: protein arginine kinase [Clostridiales bacterium]|jgi:protein arginine kinase|nr:protein arginine kinase [Clostridiales bacterium]